MAGEMKHNPGTMLDALNDADAGLRPKDIDFLESIANDVDSGVELTEKQYEWLEDLYYRHC